MRYFRGSFIFEKLYWQLIGRNSKFAIASEQKSHWPDDENSFRFLAQLMTLSRRRFWHDTKRSQCLACQLTKIANPQFFLSRYNSLYFNPCFLFFLFSLFLLFQISFFFWPVKVCELLLEQLFVHRPTIFSSSKLSCAPSVSSDKVSRRFSYRDENFRWGSSMCQESVIKKIKLIWFIKTNVIIKNFFHFAIHCLVFMFVCDLKVVKNCFFNLEFSSCETSYDTIDRRLYNFACVNVPSTTAVKPFDDFWFPFRSHLKKTIKL